MGAKPIKLLLFLITFHSRHSTSGAIRCFSGYDLTGTAETDRKAPQVVECDKANDACYAAKGSYVIDGKTYDVKDVRGCGFKDSCKEVEEQIKDKSFYVFLVAYLNEERDIDSEEMAESEGSIPSDMICCFEPSCNDKNFKIAEPTVETTVGPTTEPTVGPTTEPTDAAEPTVRAGEAGNSGGTAFEKNSAVVGLAIACCYFWYFF